MCIDVAGDSFKICSMGINEENQTAPIAILLRKLEEAKTRNPRLSQRGFALKLGLSSGAFSEILQGKRLLSHQIKLRIAPRLQLSPKEEADFFQEGLPPQLQHRQSDSLKLSNDQFHLISDWWHFAILNLTRTKGFKNHVTWIARRLGMANKVVTEALDRLFRLGFLEKTTDGRVARKHANLQTTDDLFSLSIQRSHLEDLKLIEKSLNEIPIHLRDMTSVTFVVNKRDLSKAKEMIRVFQDQFLNRVEANHGEEVYRLSIALFPLTQVQEET